MLSVLFSPARHFFQDHEHSPFGLFASDSAGQGRGMTDEERLDPFTTTYALWRAGVESHALSFRQL